jgi:hypothetical protein
MSDGLAYAWRERRDLRRWTTLGVRPCIFRACPGRGCGVAFTRSRSSSRSRPGSRWWRRPGPPLPRGRRGPRRNPRCRLGTWPHALHGHAPMTSVSPVGWLNGRGIPGAVVSACGDGGHVYRGVHEDLAARTCVAWRQDADLAGHVPGRRLGTCGERRWQRRRDRSRGWRQGRPYAAPTGPRDLRVLHPDRLSGSDWITGSTTVALQVDVWCGPPSGWRALSTRVSQGCAVDQRRLTALVGGRPSFGLIPSRCSSLPASRSSSSPMVR